jgi:hypothetical protein
MNQPDTVLTFENRPSVIPVLTAVLSPEQIPPALSLALDAKANDKAVFWAMADAWARRLRPELERLTTELVNRSLQQAWVLRSQGVREDVSQNEVHKF